MDGEPRTCEAASAPTVTVIDLPNGCGPHVPPRPAPFGASARGRSSARGARARDAYRRPRRAAAVVHSGGRFARGDLLETCSYIFRDPRHTLAHLRSSSHVRNVAFAVYAPWTGNGRASWSSLATRLAGVVGGLRRQDDGFAVKMTTWPTAAPTVALLKKGLSGRRGGVVLAALFVIDCLMLDGAENYTDGIRRFFYISSTPRT